MQGFMASGLPLTQFWIARRGQDLIEYALLAGFVAVVAAALVPGIATNISTIFSQVITTIGGTSAGSQTTL